MEETEVSVDFLMACALHPNTWLSWVPEEIVNQVPLDCRVSISCTPNKVWIIADTEHNVVFSSSPVKIIKEEKRANGINLAKLLFAALSKSEPDPQEPPPKRVA